MEKKIRTYTQHSEETCGPSCVLMLLEHYGRIDHPTRKLEEKIYRRYKVNGYKGMTGAAVARCLSNPREALESAVVSGFSGPEKALGVHLVQSFEERMGNGGLFSREDHEKIADSHLMHLKFCKDRIRFSPGVAFDLEFLKQELKAGRKIILEIFVPEVEDGPPKVLHWVILENYDEGKALFRIQDPIPRREAYCLTAQELEGYMETPIGRICIVVGEKKWWNASQEPEKK